MKEQIWYSATHNEIWLKVDPYRIIRGSQAIIDSVPDYLDLYLWAIDRKKWKRHLAKGWLIRLE